MDNSLFRATDNLGSHSETKNPNVEINIKGNLSADLEDGKKAFSFLLSAYCNGRQDLRTVAIAS